MPCILLCDDEAAMRFALAEVLVDAGHSVLSADSGAAALAHVHAADVLVTDLSMPGMDGMELLARAKVERPMLPVIVVTARGSERAAVAAIKAGASDYLAKPFDNDELLLAVDQALGQVAYRRSARQRGVEQATGRPFIGESPCMQRLYDAVERLAARDVPVLVRGETGTGKEHIAAMLHWLGPRKSGPLVAFNCAAVPAELAESELFGHVRGAFTGASQARTGLFAEADGGTLILDEIGELPLAIAPKLLRVLQEGEMRPVGSSRATRVDVRIVSCTHRDLRAEVRDGRFREDLYYRLAVVDLVVPPLAERRDDIPALARSFAARYADRFGLPPVRLRQDLLDHLVSQQYPGNVRELENTVARLVALSDGGDIGRCALTSAPTAPVTEAGQSTSFRSRVMQFERELIVNALLAAGDNRSEAARNLGLSRVTLLDKMKRLGIE